MIGKIPFKLQLYTTNVWLNKELISVKYTSVICCFLQIQLFYFHCVSLLFQLLSSDSTIPSSLGVTVIPASPFTFNYFIFTVCHYYSSFSLQIQLFYLHCVTVIPASPFRFNYFIFTLCHWYSSLYLQIGIAR